MKTTQYAAIGKLLQRKKGATPAELMTSSGSTCIHKRMSEMRNAGWSIWREDLKGARHGLYFGKAPKKAGA